MIKFDFGKARTKGPPLPSCLQESTSAYNRYIHVLTGAQENPEFAQSSHLYKFSLSGCPPSLR